MSGGEYEYGYLEVLEFVDSFFSGMNLVNHPQFWDLGKVPKESNEWDLESNEIKRVYFLKMKQEEPEKFELRQKFIQHLRLVAETMRAIEWVDSGDGCSEEVDLLKKCLSIK